MKDAHYISRCLTQMTRRIEVIESGLYAIRIDDESIKGVPDGSDVHNAQIFKTHDSALIEKLSEVVFNDSVDNARMYLTRLKQIHKNNHKEE